jgi:hypothetical protein
MTMSLLRGILLTSRNNDVISGMQRAIAMIEGLL